MGMQQQFKETEVGMHLATPHDSDSAKKEVTLVSSGYNVLFWLPRENCVVSRILI